MHLWARSVEMGTFKMTDSPSATRARALLPRRDAVRGVRVHDDHGAPRNGEHLDLERLARDGVHFAGAPLLLDLVVGVGVGPVEEPAAAVVAEEVRSVDGLERAVVLLEAVHVDLQERTARVSENRKEIIGGKPRERHDSTHRKSE